MGLQFFHIIKQKIGCHSYKYKQIFYTTGKKETSTHCIASMYEKREHKCVRNNYFTTGFSINLFNHCADSSPNTSLLQTGHVWKEVESAMRNIKKIQKTKYLKSGAGLPC